MDLCETSASVLSWGLTSYSELMLNFSYIYIYIYILCFLFEFCLRIHANNEIQDLQSFLLESTLGAVVLLRMDGANSQPSTRPSSVYSASSRSTTSIRNGKVRDLRYRMTDMESQVASQPCRLVCKNCRRSRACSPLDSLLSNGGSSGCGTCAQ